MSRTRNRLTGATLAILMQAGLLALLLFSRTPISSPEKLVRELTFVLPPLRPVDRLPAPARRAGPPRPLQAPLPAVPFMPNSAAPIAAPPDLSRLGQSIFGCASETWSNLMPEQRTLCARPGEGLAILEVPDLMHPPKFQVKDEAHWQEEWAREKTGLMVPCGGVMATANGPVPSINPLCVLVLLATGHGDELVDPHKWPHYAIKQLSDADYSKIEQAYDDWHKAHPVKPAAAPPPGENPP